MGEEDSEKPAVGKTYKGSLVVNIEEERSTRPNGVVRVRKSIELDSGMILLEDVYEDKQKIEGEYKELEYKEVPSPRGIKLSLDKKKKKKLTLSKKKTHQRYRGPQPLRPRKTYRPHRPKNRRSLLHRHQQQYHHQPDRWHPNPLLLPHAPIWRKSTLLKNWF